MAETTMTNKRPRVDSDGPTESPEAKRIRESLIDILDDESGDRDDATQDLAFFMKSFEEEIGLSPSNSLPTPSLAAPDSAESQPELGFLLEASDDELGLPPTSSGVEDEKEGAVDVLRGVSEAVGFDPIWGFGDEIMGSGFGFCAEEEEPVILGSLFDYPDAVSEFSWRTESLPAAILPAHHHHIRQMSMDRKSALARVTESGLLKTQGLIGGIWMDAFDGKSIKVHNPATGDVVASVPCMGKQETTDAISSAYDAFNSWSKITASERSKCLRKWYDLLIAHKEVLALLITLEQGKPLKEALGEVNYGASFIEFFAEEAKRVYGDIIPPTLPDRRLFVLKQPVGVVGAITPWNFPLAMITRKVGPALACGCTVVIKPSELTPLTALAAAELSLQAGIPPGVVNVVMGDAADIGDTLLASSQVRKITFTGSTAVGKKLMAGSAGTVKKVSLELGGNAPCIVFDDADLDVAVKGSLAAKFRNSGQTCVCANRIIVQEGIYEKFARAFATAVQNLEVGDGLIEGVSQGPLINESAVQKVESLIQDAASKGAKVLLGGKRHSLGMTFYEPTVLTDVQSEMLISREEAFGPVAPLLRFKTEEEAIRIANDTNAGLAAYVFTTNIARSWRVSEALEYGLVGINEGIISTEVAPFGGVKQSGLGREGSKYGMDEYLEIKYVCLGNMNAT